MCGKLINLPHIDFLTTTNKIPCPKKVKLPSTNLWNKGTERYNFLDLYRGIIVVFMLEGHVVRELLNPALQATTAFSYHEIFHGITAPGFLFGSGFTFAIATTRKWQYAVRMGKPFLRRVLRAITLILIGYALHFPYLSISKTLEEATPAQWDAFFQFDVLQCIGFSLLLMRFLLFVLRNEKHFIVSLTLLLVLIIYSTPLLSTIKASSIPLRAIVAAINTTTGSIYPLFPYSGFLLAGTLVSWRFLVAVQNGRETIFIHRLLGLGIFLVAASSVLEHLPIQTYPAYDFWTGSPNYFWMRLGILCILLGLLWYFENFFSLRGGFLMPQWLTKLGVESLFVYIAHLIIIYGWVINADWNLSAWLSLRCNIFTALTVFLLLTFTLVLAAYGWHYLKKKHPILMNGILWWMTFCVVYQFLASPY